MRRNRIDYIGRGLAGPDGADARRETRAARVVCVLASCRRAVMRCSVDGAVTPPLGPSLPAAARRPAASRRARRTAAPHAFNENDVYIHVGAATRHRFYRNTVTDLSLSRHRTGAAHGHAKRDGI